MQLALHMVIERIFKCEYNIKHEKTGEQKNMSRYLFFFKSTYLHEGQTLFKGDPGKTWACRHYGVLLVISMG